MTNVDKLVTIITSQWISTKPQKSAEIRNIYKPSHVRYQINKERVDNVKSGAPAVGPIVVSSTDSLQSEAKGTRLQEGEVGSKATIKIKTRDFDGNQCYDENDQI